MPSETDRKVRNVIKRFRKEGWEEQQGKGSHVIFKKEGKTISVPTSKDPIKLGTYQEIAKQAGWR